MSRRPPTTPEEELSRAVGRMAPGGRMWSESPIPRYAIRKIRAAGVEVVQERFYATTGGKGYSTHTPPRETFQLEWWDPSLPGGSPGNLPPDGAYMITFDLLLTAVQPADTTITFECSYFIPWLADDLPGEEYVTLTDGPWTVGQRLTFTIHGGIIDGFGHDLIVRGPAPGYKCDWAFDYAASFFTVEPASWPPGWSP